MRRTNGFGFLHLNGRFLSTKKYRQRWCDAPSCAKKMINFSIFRVRATFHMNALIKAIKYEIAKTHPKDRRRQRNLLITAFGTSWLIAFLGWTLFQAFCWVYQLPTEIKANASSVFFLLGMFCMHATGIIYFFSLWSEWLKYPFFYKLRSIFALLLFVFFSIIWAFPLSSILNEIIAL